MDQETKSPMLADEIRIETVHQLKQHVYHTLCNHEQLEPGVFPMTERVLVRGGHPCGVSFCLHGPRSVKYTSIWETDSNTILFYGADGDRFLKTRLLAGPSLEGRQMVA